MNRAQAMLLGSFVLVLSMISMAFTPPVTYAEAQVGGRGRVGNWARMRGMFGAEAPLISIALKHQRELNLTSTQVSTLEQIRSGYQNQTTPIQQQLRGIEGEIAALLQESPANLIQVKLKIEQAAKLRSELRYLRVEALENGKSVLTAQQRDQLKNLIAAMRHNFRRPQGQAS